MTTEGKRPHRVRFAGFVPFCKKYGRWWLLLGLESDGWGVFGGGPEVEDATPAETAVREAIEESHGLLDKGALQRAVSHGPVLATRHAIIYAVAVPWHLSESMRSMFARQAGRLEANGCFEKKAAAWFALDDFEHPQSRQVSGARLRAPLPFNRNIASHLEAAWPNLEVASWSICALSKRERQMDKVCDRRQDLSLQPTS